MEDWGIHSVKLINFGGLTPLDASKKYHMLVVDDDGSSTAEAHHNSVDLIGGYVEIAKRWNSPAPHKVVIEWVEGDVRHIVIHQKLQNGDWERSHTKGKV